MWFNLKTFNFYIGEMGFPYHSLLEPVSSTPPKLSVIDARPMLAPLNQATSLVCPAQGFPAPAFRYILYFSSR